jgi:putative lipoprotein
VTVSASSELVGTWDTESIDGAPLPPGVASSITFGPDGAVFGRGGVNTFRGSYERTDGAVELGPLATTLMAGPEPASRHESAMLTLLSGRLPLAVDGDTLVLGDGGRQARFRRRADRLEVAGTVAYRERLALPPGAVITVRVLDVSRADAPSTTLAEQVITPDRQVPIPFSLTVDRSALDDRHTYALSAQITVDGRLWWTTDTHVPVPLDGPATGLEVLLVRTS